MRSIAGSTFAWFAVLLAVCVIGIYAFHLRPRTRRGWLLVALAIAFLAWLLPFMATVRAQ
jgi:hypothetical protein